MISLHHYRSALPDLWCFLCRMLLTTSRISSLIRWAQNEASFDMSIWKKLWKPLCGVTWTLFTFAEILCRLFKISIYPAVGSFLFSKILAYSYGKGYCLGFLWLDNNSPGLIDILQSYKSFPRSRTADKWLQRSLRHCQTGRPGERKTPLL